LSAIADAAKGTGMMKDLLTGEKLAERDRLVSSANDSFYNAYEAGNFDAMAKVWGRAPHVKCSHPGRCVLLFLILDRALIGRQVYMYASGDKSKIFIYNRMIFIYEDQKQ